MKRIRVVVLLSLILAALTQASPARAASTSAYLYYRFAPPVIFNDGTSSTRAWIDAPRERSGMSFKPHEVTGDASNASSLQQPTRTVTPPPACRPPVISSFTASPSEITQGETSTLRWGVVLNATSAEIDHGVGQVSTPGSAVVGVNTTRTYTLTARGCGGTVTRQVTISVTPSSRPCSPTTAPASAYLYSRFDPPVIFNDDASSTTLEVITTGKDIAKVFVRSDEDVQLYDDGTHGDRLANDGIFTLSGLTTGQIARWWSRHLGSGGSHTIYSSGVKIIKTCGEEEKSGGERIAPTIGIVDKAQRFPAVKVGDGLYATEYAFFIVDPTGETLGVKPPLGTVKCCKTTKFYSVFPDQFDFLAVMPSGTLLDPQNNYSVSAPFFRRVKNEVRHIGLPQYNETAEFGSKGRLIGVVYHHFDNGPVLAHEVGHAWSAYMAAPLDLGGAFTDAYGSHWNKKTDIGGLMSCAPGAGGTKFVSNGDGTFRLESQGFQSPYAKLDLYLMGLIPPSEVPPVRKLINPNFSNPNRVTAERVETYTIQQLMQAEGGERIPNWKDSPKAFTFGLIVVKGAEFTEAEFAFFSLVARYFGSKQQPEDNNFGINTFYAATGGRATLNTRLADFVPHLNIPRGSSAPWEIPAPTATRPSLPTLPSTPSPSPPSVAPTPTQIAAAVIPSPKLPVAPTPAAPSAPSIPSVECLPTLAVIAGATYWVRRRART